MSAFDYFALIIAIPLGLALVEIAQGLSNFLRRRPQVRIGVLTPLLAVFLLLIISNVWLELWEAQARVAITLPLIFFGLCTAIIFYLTASFIFPGQSESYTDLDDWFMRNRRFSLGGTFLVLILLKLLLEVGFSNWPYQGNIARKVGYVVGWGLRPSIILVIVFAQRRAVILGAMVFLSAIEIATLMSR